jgi:hypothetical protein
MPVIKTAKRLEDICNPKGAELGDALPELHDVSRLRTCPCHELWTFALPSEHRAVGMSCPSVGHIHL